MMVLDQKKSLGLKLIEQQRMDKGETDDILFKDI